MSGIGGIMCGMKTEQNIYLSPVDENHPLICGACRPGWPLKAVADSQIKQWIRLIKSSGIEKVCCLLSPSELNFYDRLLPAYEQAFGPAAVLHAPVLRDWPPDLLQIKECILPFLGKACTSGRGCVVHASAGYARTGLILALWLSASQNLDQKTAVEIVRSSGRDPLELLTDHPEYQTHLEYLFAATQRISIDKPFLIKDVF